MTGTVHRAVIAIGPALSAATKRGFTAGSSARSHGPTVGIANDGSGTIYPLVLRQRGAAMQDSVTLYTFDTAANCFRGPIKLDASNDINAILDSFDETVVIVTDGRYFVLDANGLGEWNVEQPLMIHDDSDNGDDDDGLIFWQSDFCRNAAKPH